MEITHKAQIFVENLFKEKQPKNLVYHTYAHTELVAKTAEKISEGADISAEEKEIVSLAAWFHTSGYLHTYEDYLSKSQEIAKDFLTEEKEPLEKINRVLEAIADIKNEVDTPTGIGAIMHDALIAPLAQEGYFKASRKLRKEKELINKTIYTDMEWFQSRVKHVIENSFITAYGKEVLEPAKDKVLKNIKKKMKKHQAELDISMEKELGVSPAELKELKKKLSKVEGRPERGIETMFRLTSKNHLTLSGMADTKANIMISVNSIILSILIGSLMQKLDNNPQLTIPLYVMLVVNLGSIIFSILSTRPNITSGKFTRADIENHKTNLLFFGNFHKMDRPDYQWGMQRLMENGKYLYSSLIDDIFFLGVVLGRKYRFLRIAYNIFMYGLVLAVITFMISNMIFGDV